MRKFILKTSIFLSPILVLFIFLELFYSTKKGDLIRIGLQADLSGYDGKKLFKPEYDNGVYFANLSAINLDSQHKYTVLTIGDSFSEQAEAGYNNYLAKDDSIQVVHCNAYLNKNYNTISALYGILNGNLLDKINIKYVILESVERHFVGIADNIDTNRVINKDSIVNLTKRYNLIRENAVDKDYFFSKEILEFPLTNLYYLFDDNAYSMPTYKVKTTQQLFSVNKKELLFYDQDLSHVKANNDLDNLSRVNNELNKVSSKFREKGIRLIVLPCPDKFDFYYNYIVGNSKYPKPLFFEYFERMPKDYIYVNSRQILMNEIKIDQDVYLYDDTHWSPNASKIIAREIAEIINKR